VSGRGFRHGRNAVRLALYVNITDDLEMPIPAFGPIVVE
jgi:hypothetical protein